MEGHATDQRAVCLLEPATNASANRSRAVCHRGDRGLECLKDMLLGLPTVQGAEYRGVRQTDSQLVWDRLQNHKPSLRLYSKGNIQKHLGMQ